MPSDALTIAAAQYPIDDLGSWERYRAKLAEWVARGAAEHARILVFPEYGSMELVSLLDRDLQADLAGQLEALQQFHEPMLALHRELAAEHGVYIVAASFPVAVAPRDYRNRAWLVAPDGHAEYQEKLLMTRFEDEVWGIRASSDLRVFDTALGPIGILICYDSEFPLLARRQVEAGAEILLVPSCTETLAGFYRVRIGCQARALENQCYVVQSPTVGDAPWSPAVDRNNGIAAVYTPAERQFPSDGVLVQGELNRPQWVVGTVDRGLIRWAREDGTVLNHRQWGLQGERTAGGVTRISL